MKSKKTEERTTLRERFWPDDKAWTGEDSKGWFRAPRTLSLLLALLKSKRLSDRQDPSMVYLGLWARHFDSGIVEIMSEREMAYEAGYSGNRALRTWQERMRLLERLGFIKTQRIGNEPFRYVLMLEPGVSVDALAAKGKIDQSWKATYDARRIATKEAIPSETPVRAREKIVRMPRTKAK